MDIKTTETHQRNHAVVLSKQQVENILSAHMLKTLNLSQAIPRKDIRVEWNETSTNSGMSKEPQLVLRITEDLTDKTTVREPERRPPEKASGLGDIECSIPLPSVSSPMSDREWAALPAGKRDPR